MRESELLGHIYARSADLAGIAGEFGSIEVGPGDDCAVVRTPDGRRLLIGVDQLVAGRHFEASMLETDEGIDLVARKAVARSVSDIAAMGGAPCWGLATALLPDGFGPADALFDAMARWARHWGCPLIGGDIASGRGPLSLTVTIAGFMPWDTAPLLRSGARPGDEIWLTGQVGGSFESGWHLRFEPRLEAGQMAARSRRIRAAIDLSDGLGRDAARIGAASGTVLELRAASLPVSHRCTDWRQAAGEGEDYELLLCALPRHPEVDAPPIGVQPPLLGPVGVVRAPRGGEKPGAVIVDAHGTGHDAADLGWNH